MIEATPDGSHMSLETYKKVIRFIQDNELALVILSGGEPTDHPNFLEFANIAKASGLYPLILSNGMFLNDAEKREQILSLGIGIQVTNDARFYPIRIPEIEHQLLGYEHEIRLVTPLGRARINGLASDRLSPLCFNLRSIVRHFRNFAQAVLYLRMKEKMCTPSVNVDGTIVAGESSLCCPIGTVDSTGEELVDGILNMQCNKCGLESNLSPLHRRAIYGESVSSY